MPSIKDFISEKLLNPEIVNELENIKEHDKKKNALQSVIFKSFYDFKKHDF